MALGKPFRAFVSYCHADAAFAARLQRQLEAYRLPRRLADQIVPFPGEAADRVGPVFRDRADLSAAEDLSAAVRDAIARSSGLIVVASPDAAKSRWVEQEIQLFRQLHPGAPILVALARGEPEDSLPDVLRSGGIEPLAADFRKEGDGKRLAFLKIVAALLDLPLDALVQRDAQRQVRRVTAITTGAVVMVVIMAMLLAMALRSRAEAEHQRVGAEGLVEYMLTDLRGALRGVGRPEVMAAVNQRAMAYYSAQGALTDLPDASLERRARVIHAIGEDEEALGNLDTALSGFREAHRTTEAILARHPGDPEAIFAHAQSEYWVGYAAWRREDRSTATRHWRAYLEQARALARSEPGSARSLMEQGYGEGNLCDLNRQNGFDLKSAEAHCAAAVRFAAAALRKSPTNRDIMASLANRHGWMAQVQLDMSRPDDAFVSREEEAALLDRLLVLDPANVEYSLRRSWADLGMANILLGKKRFEDAADLISRSIERHHALFSLNSGNIKVIEARMKAWLVLARARRDLGQDHSVALAKAVRQQQLLASAGKESAARAGAAWNSIWSEAGGN